jgi:hypothetical protein
MRFRGNTYTGKGVVVAVIDSGIDVNDPRMQGVKISGWSIQLTATGHAGLGSDFHDENGHGTDIAATILRMAPEVELVAIKIMDRRLYTSADLMAAGIETAHRHGAHIINLSAGTPNMGKSALLRDCCAMANEAGAVVLAAAHPKGERAYPADLPETVGVSAHPDCPVDKFYYFDPRRFPPKEWGSLSQKFLTHGFQPGDAERRSFRGSGFATAYLAGRFGCVREALGPVRPEALIEVMQHQALTPVPEIGYA